MGKRGSGWFSKRQEKSFKRKFAGKGVVKILIFGKKERWRNPDRKCFEEAKR